MDYELGVEYIRHESLFISAWKRSPKSCICLIAGLLFLCYRVYLQWQEKQQEHAAWLEQRRRVGIPPEDKRPWGIAFADAQKRKKLQKQQQQPQFQQSVFPKSMSSNLSRSSSVVMQRPSTPKSSMPNFQFGSAYPEPSRTPRRSSFSRGTTPIEFNSPRRSPSVLQVPPSIRRRTPSSFNTRRSLSIGPEQSLSQNEPLHANESKTPNTNSIFVPASDFRPRQPSVPLEVSRQQYLRKRGPEFAKRAAELDSGPSSPQEPSKRQRVMDDSFNPDLLVGSKSNQSPKLGRKRLAESTSTMAYDSDSDDTSMNDQQTTIPYHRFGKKAKLDYSQQDGDATTQLSRSASVVLPGGLPENDDEEEQQEKVEASIPMKEESEQTEEEQNKVSNVPERQDSQNVVDMDQVQEHPHNDLAAKVFKQQQQQPNDQEQEDSENSGRRVPTWIPWSPVKSNPQPDHETSIYYYKRGSRPPATGRPSQSSKLIIEKRRQRHRESSANSNGMPKNLPPLSSANKSSRLRNPSSNYRPSRTIIARPRPATYAERFAEGKTREINLPSSSATSAPMAATTNNITPSSATTTTPLFGSTLSTSAPQSTTTPSFSSTNPTATATPTPPSTSTTTNSSIFAGLATTQAPSTTTTTTTTGATTSAKPNSIPSFSFSSVPAQSSNQAPNVTPSTSFPSANLTTNAPATSNGFSFNTPAPTPSETKPNATTASSAFSFGSAPSAKRGNEASTQSQAPSMSLGNGSKRQASDLTGTQAPAAKSSSFSFGESKPSLNSTSSFSFGSKPDSQPGPATASSNTPFSFGTAPLPKSTSSNTLGSSTGSSTGSAPSFNFGQSTSSTVSTNLGGTANTNPAPSFSFGTGNNAQTTTTSSSSTFNFGTPPAASSPGASLFNIGTPGTPGTPTGSVSGKPRKPRSRQ